MSDFRMGIMLGFQATEEGDADFQTDSGSRLGKTKQGACFLATVELCLLITKGSTFPSL